MRYRMLFAPVACLVITPVAAESGDLATIMEAMGSEEEGMKTVEIRLPNPFGKSSSGSGSEASPGNKMLNVGFVHGSLMRSGLSPREMEEVKKDFKRMGLEPLPSTGLMVAFGEFMCVYYMIDEKVNGVVTHSGSICSSWGGWIGQESGPAHEVFGKLGGPQKAYETLVSSAAKALKALRN